MVSVEVERPVSPTVTILKGHPSFRAPWVGKVFPATASELSFSILSFLLLSLPLPSLPQVRIRGVLPSKPLAQRCFPGPLNFETTLKSQRKTTGNGEGEADSLRWPVLCALPIPPTHTSITGLITPRSHWVLIRLLLLAAATTTFYLHTSQSLARMWNKRISGCSPGKGSFLIR